MSSRSTIAALQIGRALAALLVVLHHAEQAANSFSSGADRSIFTWGQFGVDFFFVLSGFIIYYSHRSDDKGITPSAAYIRKRFLRIYIPYLPIGIGMVLIKHPSTSSNSGRLRFSMGTPRIIIERPQMRERRTARAAIPRTWREHLNLPIAFSMRATW